MPRYVKNTLCLILGLGILIILFSIVVFSINGNINWFYDIDNKKFEIFGIYGEFIGGISGTIFTLMATILVWLTYNSQREELEQTRNLLIKQVELSYKPDLFIKDAKIYIYGTVNNGILCPNYISNNHNNSKELRSDACVELINIGREVSKRLNYHWECNLKEIKYFFDKNFSDNEINISFPNQNNSISYTSLNRSQLLAPLDIISFNQTTDFILPYKTNETGLNIRLPVLYFEWIISSIILQTHNNSKNNVFHDIFNPIEFPKLHLDISFGDILGETHIKRFTVKLNFPSGIRHESKKEGEITEIAEIHIELKEQDNKKECTNL